MDFSLSPAFIVAKENKPCLVRTMNIMKVSYSVQVFGDQSIYYQFNFPEPAKTMFEKKSKLKNYIGTALTCCAGKRLETGERQKAIKERLEVSGMKRDIRLDSIRGLVLAWMTINHLSGPLYAYSFQTLGFVSSAEPFVFISGVTAGMVYGRIGLRRGVSRCGNALSTEPWISIYSILPLFFSSCYWK